MKRIISVLAVAAVMAALIAVVALPAFAVGNNPPTSCGLGKVSSMVAHAPGNFPQILKQGGLTPGEAFQQNRAEDTDDICHDDDPGQNP